MFLGLKLFFLVIKSGLYHFKNEKATTKQAKLVSMR